MKNELDRTWNKLKKSQDWIGPQITFSKLQHKRNEKKENLEDKELRFDKIWQESKDLTIFNKIWRDYKFLQDYIFGKPTTKKNNKTGI